VGFAKLAFGCAIRRKLNPPFAMHKPLTTYQVCKFAQNVFNIRVLIEKSNSHLASPLFGQPKYSFCLPQLGQK